MQKISSLSDLQKVYNKQQEDAGKASESEMSFHDKIVRDHKADPTPFAARNKALITGRDDFADLKSAYRNPAHNRHSEAQKTFKEHNYNDDALLQDCINTAVRRAGGRMLEAKNTDYENAVLNCIQGAANDADDIAMATKCKSVLKQKWHDRGYMQPTDITAFDQFMKDHRLTTSSVIRPKIEKVIHNYFGKELDLVKSSVGGAAAAKMKALRDREAEANAKRDANREAQKQLK